MEKAVTRLCNEVHLHVHETQGQLELGHKPQGGLGIQ